jgi:hypothetical protein
MAYRSAQRQRSIQWCSRLSTAANDLLKRLQEAGRSMFSDNAFRRANDDFMPLPW